MTVDEALRKAVSRFIKAKSKREDIKAKLSKKAMLDITFEPVLTIALLYMIEDLARIISSGSHSTSSTRSK